MNMTSDISSDKATIAFCAPSSLKARLMKGRAFIFGISFMRILPPGPGGFPVGSGGSPSAGKASSGTAPGGDP
jgi:hypothetical protein